MNKLSFELYKGYIYSLLKTSKNIPKQTFYKQMTEKKDKTRIKIPQSLLRIRTIMLKAIQHLEITILINCRSIKEY